MGSDKDKIRAVESAMSQIERQFGKGAIMKLGSQEVIKVPVIPTGSLALDFSLGIGGLPRGRVIEIYGPESSGKTTLALHAAAECHVCLPFDGRLLLTSAKWIRGSWTIKESATLSNSHTHTLPIDA